eukprot:Clim_evm14s13 gene=Clim_evmTU14s13
MELFGLLFSIIEIEASEVKPEWKPCALERVEVKAEVIDCITEVTIAQTYRNPLPDRTVEAEYVFPLDEKSAVCSFTATLEDGRLVKGVVQEKLQARKTYDRALARGDGAYLLEQDKPDIFRCKVGNLEPGMSVRIELKYVAELKVEGDDVRFVLPTCVGERYTPAEFKPAYPKHESGMKNTAETAKLTSGNSNTVPCTLIAHFAMRSAITELRCPTLSEMEGESEEFLNISYSERDRKKATVRLNNVQLDRDLVIKCRVENPHEPRLNLEQSPEDGTGVAMLTLVPDFELLAAGQACDKYPVEMIFVVDRSGSMGGPRIERAREAMKLMLKSLPVEHVHFNIVGFGSRFQTLFEGQSRPYTESNLKQAMDHVTSEMQSNLGGTELLKPLQHIHHSLPRIPGHRRQILVLTDGQVSNTEAVLSYVQEMCSPEAGNSGVGSMFGGKKRASSGHTRFFSVGIGSSVSHHLVEGLARNGQGTAVFVNDREPMQTKLQRHLKQAVAPALRNVSVTWGDEKTSSAEGAEAGDQEPSVVGRVVKSIFGYRRADDDVNGTGKPEQKTTGISTTEALTMQSPCVVPPLFDGERFLIFRRFADATSLPKSVTLSATVPSFTSGMEIIEEVLQVTLTTDEIYEGLTVHRMAARAAIRDLEEGRVEKIGDPKPEIVRLGCKYSLASAHTSFVAVEKRNGDGDGDATEKVLECVEEEEPEPEEPQMESARLFARVSCAAPAAPKMKKKAMFGGGGGGPKFRNRRSAMAPQPPPAPCAMACPMPAMQGALPGGGYAVDAVPASTGSAMMGMPGMRGDARKEEERCKMDLCIDDDECDECEEEAGEMLCEGGDAGVHERDRKALSQKPVAAPALRPREVVMRLADLQKFDGSFELTDELIALDVSGAALGCSTVEAVVAKLDGVTDARVAGTLFALALLQSAAGLRKIKDEWEMLAQKARKFLNAQTQGANLSEYMTKLTCQASPVA